MSFLHPLRLSLGLFLRLLARSSKCNLISKVVVTKSSKRDQNVLVLKVDLVLDDASVKSDMLEGVKRLGMRWLDEGDHIHVQALPPGG